MSKHPLSRGGGGARISKEKLVTNFVEKLETWVSRVHRRVSGKNSVSYLKKLAARSRGEKRDCQKSIKLEGINGGINHSGPVPRGGIRTPILSC